MKKIISSSIVAAVMVIGVNAAPVIYWGSDYAFTGTGAPDCWDRDGNVILMTSDFAVQLLRSDSMAPLYTVPSGDGFWSVAGANGVGFTTIPETTPNLDDWNGLSVITRVWANAVPGATPYYADTPAQLLSWDVGSPPPAAELNFSQVTQPMWVPEPGTGLLVLAGAAVAIFRRRRAEA
jgi:hypothetical protein